MRKGFILFSALAIVWLSNSSLWAEEPETVYSGENAEKLIPAERGEKFSFGAEADFVSRYIWRGMAFSQGPVLQPSMWLSAYGATFSVWGNFVLNDEPNQGQLNEVDFTLSYSYEYKSLFAGGSLLFYLYPHQGIPNSGEASIVLGFQKGPFKIFTTQYVDVIAAPGAYFGLASGSFEKNLHPKLSLKTSLGLGLANGKFNEFYLQVPRAKANVLSWDLEFHWAVHGPLYLRPHMQVTTLLSSSLRDNVENPTIVSGGLGVGVGF